MAQERKRWHSLRRFDTIRKWCTKMCSYRFVWSVLYPSAFKLFRGLRIQKKNFYTLIYSADLNWLKKKIPIDAGDMLSASEYLLGLGNHWLSNCATRILNHHKPTAANKHNNEHRKDDEPFIHTYIEGRVICIGPRCNYDKLSFQLHSDSRILMLARQFVWPHFIANADGFVVVKFIDFRRLLFYAQFHFNSVWTGADKKFCTFFFFFSWLGQFVLMTRFCNVLQFHFHPEATPVLWMSTEHVPFQQCISLVRCRRAFSQPNEIPSQKEASACWKLFQCQQNAWKRRPL